MSDYAIDGNRHLGQRVLTLAEVVAKTGMSKSTVYASVRADEFPAPMKLTVRKSGWLLSEIDYWIDQRRAQRDAANLKGARS